MNGTPASGMDPSTIVMIFGIWSIVGIAFYVWYLWALSKLFPRIDLPSSHGWIPVWNQWQLIGRAGLPGWMVLLGFVPGLSIVVLVVSVIAIHRLNTEYGKGGGFTVLGAFIPPLWAMLLATHIDETGNGPVRSASPQAYAPPGYAPAAQQQAAPGYGYEMPPVPAQAVPGFAASQPVASQPVAPQPVAHQAPYSQAPAAPQAPSVPQVPSVPAAPPAQAAAPAASQQRIAPVPPAPGMVQQAQSQSPAQQAPQQAQQQMHQQGGPQQHAPQQGAGSQSPWGFSNTTEDAFERLAAQGAGPQPETPLGHVEPQRPFSWPGPEESSAPRPESRGAERPSMPTAAPAADAPATEAPAPAVSAQTPSSSAAEAVAAPSETPSPGSASSSAPADAGHADEPEASIFSDSRSDTASAPVAPASPDALASSAAGAAAGVDAAAAAGTPVAPRAAAPVDDDEDDRTVVVPRRKRWGLELPGGEVHELVGDDVVVGRKPDAPDGASVLKIIDPTRTLSKTHLRMRRIGDQWTVEDLQSTNGVSVADGDEPLRVIEAGREVAVSERLVIGTLEVSLREIK
ncbi:DUF5684 domain-containing protein [Leucobacter ruminantium]|uniref:FHA domain-containing protein n=1 Tax=Leucobacter ruminantium TaxID=1289170 RepID=A0A939LX81_9MICO|nr:DUF5684 domain-containing protein [Leucobacter ruminantium]MBO1805771.1 FHA domain-containing protein [Leucobacter ruminantium]